jgi:hypothetical protein
VGILALVVPFYHQRRLPAGKINPSLTMLGDEEGSSSARSGRFKWEPHSHANEQIVWMLKGKMEFRLGSEQRVCGPGDVVVIPGRTEHEGWLLEDTEVIDFFGRRLGLIVSTLRPKRCKVLQTKPLQASSSLTPGCILMPPGVDREVARRR